MLKKLVQKRDSFILKSINIGEKRNNKEGVKCALEIGGVCQLVKVAFVKELLDFPLHLLLCAASQNVLSRLKLIRSLANSKYG